MKNRVFYLSNKVILFSVVCVAAFVPTPSESKSLFCFSGLMKAGNRDELINQLLERSRPTKNSNELLILAIELGASLRTIESLIAGGADRSLRWNDGSLVSLALLKGRFELAQALVDRLGVRIDSSDLFVLARADYRSWAPKTDLVEKIGDSLLSRDTLDRRANQLRIESLKFLLRYGVDPNAYSKSGASPLVFYLRNNTTRGSLLPVARLLLEAGLDPNILDERRDTALSLAIVYRDFEVAFYLASQSGVDVSNRPLPALRSLRDLALDRGAPDELIRTLGK